MKYSRTYNKLKFIADNYGKLGSKEVAMKCKISRPLLFYWVNEMKKHGLKIRGKHANERITISEFVARYKKETK
jgi:transposase